MAYSKVPDSETLNPPKIQLSKPPELHPSEPIAIRLCPTRKPKTDVHRERKIRHTNLVSDDAVRDYYRAAARIRETKKR